MDSSVVAALLIKAIGQQLVCVHVNHGLLRKGEPEQVIEVFSMISHQSRLELSNSNKSSCLKKPVFMRVSAISISLLITN